MPYLDPKRNARYQAAYYRKHKAEIRVRKALWYQTHKKERDAQHYAWIGKKRGYPVLPMRRDGVLPSSRGPRPKVVWGRNA